MARTIADIERVIGVPEVFEHRPSTDGPAPAGDEFDEVARARRKLEAAGMLSSIRREAETETRAAAAEADVRLQEAELKRRKLELEGEELELRLAELRQARGGGDNGTLQILTQVLQGLRDEKMSVSEQLAQMQMKFMEQMEAQAASLRQQLVDRAHSGAADAPSRRSLADEIAEIKATYEALFPHVTSAPAANLATSIDDVLKMHQVQEAHEIRMADIRRQDRMFDREVEKEDKRAAEDQRRGTALTDTLRSLVPTVETVLGRAGEHFLGGNGAAPSSAPAMEVPSPPGTRWTTCPGCQQLVGFPPGIEVGDCTNCKSRLQYQAPPAAVPFNEPAPEPMTEFAGAAG